MKKINILLLAIVLASCVNQTNYDFEKKSKLIIGIENYKSIYGCLNDSLNLWVLNKFGNYEAETIYNFYIDSLLCFNNDKSRFITCRHLYVNIPNSSSDDLQFVFGEKINDKWYFFKGASIVIPRTMIKGHPINQPLSYQQLHNIALNEVYSGYLTDKGEVNENWFTSYFEGNEWGTMKNQEYLDWCFKGKRYTNENEFYQACHLCKVKANWAQRDTTQPIKQLPIKNNNLP